MKDKVGIITFHRSRNYGAVLQTYALQKAIQEFGCDVEVIDYANKEIEDSLKLWIVPTKWNIKSVIRMIAQFVFRSVKKSAFEKFIRKNIQLTPEKNLTKESIVSISERYQYCITGSDQVWNGKLTGDDTTYFLDFVGENTQKIGYAVSVGDDIRNLCKGVSSYFDDFSYISVREEMLQEYLQQSLKKNICICCDPTLLLQRQEYEKLFDKRNCKKRYIFLYMIKYDKELEKRAMQVANKMNCVLVSNKNDARFLSHCSPGDFLSWIYHAEYIITNSFHGTVFSLLFHKQFVVSGKDKNIILNKRVYGLLTSVGLENRIIDINSLVDELLSVLPKTIVYQDVDKKVEQLRSNSVSCLLRMLEKE